MKKRILSTLFALFTIIVFGQKFELTSKGFVNSENESKKYVVIEFPEQSQADIYKKVLVMLNGKFRSASNVLSTVEPESIMINAISPQKIRRTNGHLFDIHYNIALSFKDGKVKMDAPLFELSTFDYGKKQEMYLQGGFSFDGSSFGIFKKNGDVKIDKAVEDLNNFANDFIEEIKKSNSANDDW